MEGGNPADACGAICLSFRALGKLSAKIQPTNLEMNLFYIFSFSPGEEIGYSFNY
jgi:hypothetical protein